MKARKGRGNHRRASRHQTFQTPHWNPQIAVSLYFVALPLQHRELLQAWRCVPVHILCKLIVKLFEVRSWQKWQDSTWVRHILCRAVCQPYCEHFQSHFLPCKILCSSSIAFLIFPLFFKRLLIPTAPFLSQRSCESATCSCLFGFPFGLAFPFSSVSLLLFYKSIDAFLLSLQPGPAISPHD